MAAARTVLEPGTSIPITRAKRKARSRRAGATFGGRRSTRGRVGARPARGRQAGRGGHQRSRHSCPSRRGCHRLSRRGSATSCRALTALTRGRHRRTERLCRRSGRPDRRPRSRRARHRTRRASRRRDRTRSTVRRRSRPGMLSELTGRLDVAPLALRDRGGVRGTAIGGLVRLGDLDLRENDASGALDHYALAAAAIRTQAAAADESPDERRTGRPARPVHRQQPRHRAAHDGPDGDGRATRLRGLRVRVSARRPTRSRPRWPPIR